MLDTSDKISLAGFNHMKDLIITTASLLKMSGYESTRLAVFQFSSQGTLFILHHIMSIAGDKRGFGLKYNIAAVVPVVVVVLVVEN